MEYCKNGDLFDYIKEKLKGPLPKDVAKALFVQILDGLEQLHINAGVAHLDLKLENILLTEEYLVKLCDLGFSQSVHDLIFKSVGTDGYKAPEIHCVSDGFSLSESNEPISDEGVEQSGEGKTHDP